MNISPNTGRPKITQPDRKVVANFIGFAGTIEHYFGAGAFKDDVLANAAKVAKASAEKLGKAMEPPAKLVDEAEDTA